MLEQHRVTEKNAKPARQGPSVPTKDLLYVLPVHQERCHQQIGGVVSTVVLEHTLRMVVAVEPVEGTRSAL